MRILVVGGTGLIGRPVATQLARDGFQVRLLVLDPLQAQTRLGPDFEYVAGDVTDEASVDRAVRDCDGAHVSVGAGRREDLDRVEHHGTAHVAEAAAAHGLRLVTYLTGSLVHVEYGEKIPEHRAKLAAEESVRGSGVPFVFFRPTYFIDNLPRHVQGRLAVVLGRPKPVHMVAAQDFAHMVSKAFHDGEAAGRELFVHGPEAISIADALRLYCSIVATDKRVVSLPLGLMGIVDRLFTGGKLRANLDVMDLLQRIGEHGDPAEANRLLGAPTTTVRDWCARQAARQTRP